MCKTGLYRNIVSHGTHVCPLAIYNSFTMAYMVGLCKLCVKFNILHNTCFPKVMYVYLMKS